MTIVMLRVMALELWRDRAGLILAFVLPPLVFIVFASVFGASASGKLDVRAGVFDPASTAESLRLTSDLDRVLNGRLQHFPSEAALLSAVLEGRVDAGLLLSRDLAAGSAPATVMIHPGRRAAGEVLTAEVTAAAEQGLPRIMLRRQVARIAPILSLSGSQIARLDQAPGAAPAPPFVTQRFLGGGDPIVTYYAGAVSILFLMFSAMQGAMSLIDERRGGMRLRLGLSVGGVAPLLAGRMIWLTGLGVAQALVLFVVAAVVYRVPLLQSLLPWLITAICAAAASGGIALCLASACQSRGQAQTISTFLILILAAIGGSMAPRFLMPPALQALGWFTPHAWVIEAYQTVLWRRIVDLRVVEAWAALSGFAVVGFFAALAIEGRRKL